MKGKKKKRNTLTICILAVAAVGMIAIYAALLARNQAKENKIEESIDTLIELTQFKEEDLKQIQISNSEFEFTLVQEKGWKLKEDENFPLDETRIEPIISTVCNLTALAIINEEPDDLSEYGLLNPVLTVCVTKQDGTETTFYLGDTLLADTKRYAKLEEKASIYKVENSIYSNLLVSKNDLIQAEEFPSISSEEIQIIKVESDTDENFKLTYKENNEYDFSMENANPWIIERENKSSVLADTETISEFLNNYTSFSAAACIDYRSEVWEEYGLTSPKKALSIYYLDSETSKQEEVTFYFGNQDEEGNYYVRKENSDFTYLVLQSEAEELLKMDINSLIDKHACMFPINTVDKIEIAYQEKNYTIEIERTQATGEEESFLVNGTSFPDKETMKKFYQTIIEIEGISIVPEEIKLEEPTILTISFYRNTELNSKLEISFYPYDSSYYVIAVDGKEKFFIDMREIQSFIETMDIVFGKEE